MSDFLGLMRSRIPQDCLAAECKDAGCSASLDDLEADWLLLDLDCDALDLVAVTHADFILVTSGRTIACIELKGGTLKGAKRQLQASADYASQHVASNEQILSFHPILVHEEEFSPARVREWARRKITFRGERFAIERIPCGGRLADVVS